MRAVLKINRLLALPLILGAVACNNPVERDEHPEGLIVLNASGTEVARYMLQGQVMTGQLVVGVDASSTFTVQAVSEAGTRIDIDGYELEIRLGEMHPGFTATLSGANQVVITATEAGASPLRIELWHEGHEELGATFTVLAQ